MVHLTRTRSLTEAFEHAASCARCRKSATADATALFVDYCAKGSSNLIPHQVVVALSQCIRECAEWHGPVFVHQLTHDCEVVIDSKPPPPPTEEELKEKHKAQVRLQHAQYKRMTANVQHSKSSPNDPVQGIGEGMMGYSMAMNLLVTMGTCYAVGWYLGRNMYGRTGGYVGGVIGLVGGMLVEVLLVMIYASKAEESAEKRRRRQQYFG